MDRIIEVLIYLFILSVITEKIVSLIRKYPTRSQNVIMLVSGYLFVVSMISIWEYNKYFYLLPGILFFMLMVINLTLFLRRQGIQFPEKYLNLIDQLNSLKNIEKGKKDVDEKVKEKEITLLSFSVGFVIAFIVGANFFDFFNDKSLATLTNYKFDQLFKDARHFNKNLDFNILTFLGLLVTGFFLSFGSKFFHDLLDLMFQVKNLRKKQISSDTYDVSNMKELKETLNLAHEDIVKLVFEREKERVFEINGVNGISMANIEWGNKRIRGIKISTTKPDVINIEKFKYSMPSGNEYQVPVKIVKASVAKACSGIFPSGKISNKDMNTYGTLCLPVIDENNTVYFLSCYHVVKHKYHDYKDYRTTGHETIVYNNQILGKIAKVRFNKQFDAALVKKDSGISKENIKMSIDDLYINSSRKVYSKDELSTKVMIKGATGKHVIEGRIVGTDSCQNIDYCGLEDHKLFDLIEIKDKHYENPIAQRGDSGALVYTTKGEALAMIVATDEEQSYAIPIYEILKEFKVEIY